MEVLRVTGTEDTPAIMLDKENGVFEISGRSLPEDATVFYKPVLQWLKLYVGSPNPVTDFAFKFEYFNTGSSKLILDILSELEKVRNAQVSWYFNEDDEDMEEAGEDFSQLVKVPFDFKTYE